MHYVHAELIILGKTFQPCNRARYFRLDYGLTASKLAGSRYTTLLACFMEGYPRLEGSIPNVNA